MSKRTRTTIATSTELHDRYTAFLAKHTEGLYKHDQGFQLLLDCYAQHGEDTDASTVHVELDDETREALGDTDVNALIKTLLSQHVNKAPPRRKDRVDELVETIKARNEAAEEWHGMTAINQSVLCKEGGFNRNMVKTYLAENQEAIDAYHESVNIMDDKEHNRKASAYLRRLK